MSKLILREFKGCGPCKFCKEDIDCKSINAPISITFNKSQKADNWGRLVTVFSKGETVKGYAVIKDNEVYCASAKSNIYEGYEDFINLRDVDIKILKKGEISMKFYEFNDYEYYGLVLAEDEEKAKLGYEEIIAEIDEEEKELIPDIITLEEALEIYKKSDIEDCEREEEKIEDFNKNIASFEEYVSKGTEQYLVLLMDGSLN